MEYGKYIYPEHINAWRERTSNEAKVHEAIHFAQEQCRVGRIAAQTNQIKDIIEPRDGGEEQGFGAAFQDGFYMGIAIGLSVTKVDGKSLKRGWQKTVPLYREMVDKEIRQRRREGKDTRPREMYWALANYLVEKGDKAYHLVSDLSDIASDSLVANITPRKNHQMLVRPGIGLGYDVAMNAVHGYLPRLTPLDELVEISEDSSTEWLDIHLQLLVSEDD